MYFKRLHRKRHKPLQVHLLDFSSHFVAIDQCKMHYIYISFVGYVLILKKKIKWNIFPLSERQSFNPLDAQFMSGARKRRTDD